MLKVSALALAAALAGCAIGPAYERPTSAEPAAWKEAPAAEGWLPAAPADALDRGEWWKLFGDPTLDELAARVQVSNQNIAVAVANYAQAQALVREQRAALFPSVSAGGSARREGTRGSGASNTLAASLDVDWAPDVWGRLRQAVTGAQASAQASEADLASARLSAAAKSRSTTSRCAKPMPSWRCSTSRSKATRARSRSRRTATPPASSRRPTCCRPRRCWSTRAPSGSGLARTRATLEHAIAVGVGAAPAEFSLAPVANWVPAVPGVPTGVPSTLLQRRPDIAAAERAVAAANAQIGIARSAYFPSFGLNASISSSASRVADLFNASNTLWSLGLSVAQVVFDAGAIGARVDAARAAHEARWRATGRRCWRRSSRSRISSARRRGLAQQEVLRREASLAADKTEQQFLNRYRSAQIGYTDVVTAQASALSARRARAAGAVEPPDRGGTVDPGAGRRMAGRPFGASCSCILAGRQRRLLFGAVRCGQLGAAPSAPRDST